MPAPNLPDPNKPANNGISPTVRPSIAPPPTAAMGMRPGDNVSLTIGENPTGTDEPMVPPDETMWQKYAPNGEPIVGGLASFLMHGLMILLMVVGLAWLFGGSEPIDDLDTVEVGNGEEGGGGGNVNGIKNDAPGNLTAPDQIKSLDQPKEEIKLPDQEVNVQKTVEKADDFNTIFDEKTKEKEKAVGPVLKDAIEGIAGLGKGGNGRGGGEGNGVGTGKGDGTGPGTGRNSRRGRRIMRWEMAFKTNDAEDYLRQLDALGAVIAVPDKQAKLMTIRNWKERPAKPQYEDTKAMNRIFWIDDRKESTESVGNLLELGFTPSALVAFFPRELEEELLKKELAFKNRKEEDIALTRFNMGFSGGKAMIKVVAQEPLPGHR
jgi:hypothetical protein